MASGQIRRKDALQAQEFWLLLGLTPEPSIPLKWIQIFDHTSVCMDMAHTSPFKILGQVLGWIIEKLFFANFQLMYNLCHSVLHQIID